VIETPDALIVIEGKRTESGATIDTTWLTGRHQIWRHIDAAWEIRGRRQVFGFFIVEGEDPDGRLPFTDVTLLAWPSAARRSIRVFRIAHWQNAMALPLACWAELHGRRYAQCSVSRRRHFRELFTIFRMEVSYALNQTQE
jgi:hypothetical protein